MARSRAGVGFNLYVNVLRILDYTHNNGAKEVARGDEIIITKAGKPVALLVGIAAIPAPRRPRLLKGKIWIGDDSDAPLPEDVVATFEGGA